MGTNKNWGQKTKFINEYKKLFYVWVNMKTRCYNKNGQDYKNYGARGITICQEWLSFENFVKDMESTYQEGLLIDRINNNKGYYKENCRWATRVIQNNNKRNVKRYLFQGLLHTFPEWSKILGIPESTLEQRFYCYHWSIEKCLSIPLGKNRRQFGTY